MKPYGIAISQGRIYVCDTFLGRVRVFDLKNRSFDDFIAGRGCNIKKPVNVAVDEAGTLYVADGISGQVIVCRSDGTFRAIIGAAGTNKLTDVTIEGDRLYVADMAKGRVYLYNKTSLKPIAIIPSHPTNTIERLSKPTNIAVDRRKHVYVSDAGLFCVKEYDVAGKHVRTFGRLG
ncbi:MAG: hypothetical protein WCN95_14845, partial [bacterium]